MSQLASSESVPPVKQRVISEKIPPPLGPFSPGLVVGEWVFLSGQGGFDPVSNSIETSDFGEQAEQTFRNIETLLEAAGCRMDDVVSVLVHLADTADYKAFNEIYERQFSDPKPVRTTARADLVHGMKVEITVIARSDRNPQSQAAL